MCIEAKVLRGAEIIECATVGELAAALAIDPSEASADPAGNCLCNAYWEMLGARPATSSDGWPNFEYVLTREAC